MQLKTTAKPLDSLSLRINPPAASTLSSIGVPAMWAFYFAAGVTFLVFLTGIYAPGFIVDSWSYLELSKTVFKDFYRFNTLRQFESFSPYSNTFPPLWPILLALVSRVADLGIYTGYLLNFLACVGLLATLILLFRRISYPGWVGAACYLFILGFRPFAGDALGAKTMPLTLLLLAGAVLIFVQEQITIPRVVLSALLMGLACLNRFDALAAACAIGLALIVRSYRLVPQLRRCVAIAVVYFTTLGAVLAPWAAYGMRRFDKPFPSDNVRQVMRARGGDVMDYFTAPPRVDLFQNPREWMFGLFVQKIPRVAYGFYESAVGSVLPAFAAIVLVVWGALGTPRLPAPAVPFVTLALLLIPVIMFPVVLVGYRDSRYYSGPVLIFFGVLLAILISLTPAAWVRRRSALLLLVAALPLGRSVVQPLASNWSRLLSPAQVMAPLSPTREMQQVTDAVRRDSSGQQHRLLFATGHIPSVRYGALTGEPTTLMPRLVGGTFAAFVRDWHVTHVYNPPKGPMASDPPAPDPADLIRTIETSGIDLVPLDLPGLYRIRMKANLPAGTERQSPN